MGGCTAARGCGNERLGSDWRIRVMVLLAGPEGVVWRLRVWGGIITWTWTWGAVCRVGPLAEGTTTIEPRSLRRRSLGQRVRCAVHEDLDGSLAAGPEAGRLWHVQESRRDTGRLLGYAMLQDRRSGHRVCAGHLIVGRQSDRIQDDDGRCEKRL